MRLNIHKKHNYKKYGMKKIDFYFKNEVKYCEIKACIRPHDFSFKKKKKAQAIVNATKTFKDKFG